MAAKKKSKKRPRSIKVSTAPSVPPYLLYADEMNDGLGYLILGYREPESAPSLEAATKAADKAVRTDERVRLVGIYALVATVRPDRSPVTTVLEKKDA